MIGQFLQEFLARLSVFKKAPPIDSVPAFEEFLATRAAFISQKKLYEYVKQRMGISYPKMFEDKTFIESLNIAKWHVYAACLSDLAIWMGAQIHTHTGDRDETVALTCRAFANAVTKWIDSTQFSGEIDELIGRFADRAALVDWAAMAQGEKAFSTSPGELVRWAPIADRLKDYDTEVVVNSLRFAWLGIREQFRGAIDPHAVIADWHAQPGARAG